VIENGADLERVEFSAWRTPRDFEAWIIVKKLR